MQELKINDETMDLKVHINGIPNIDKVGKEQMDNLVSTLEMKIVEFLKEKKQKH